MNKKMIGALLIIVVIFANCMINAYGNDLGNEFSISELGLNDADLKNAMVGVIRDANGNIVGTNIISSVYVDGTQVTIPAYGTYTTYQYYSTIDFFAGFYFTHSVAGNPATTRDRTLKITVRKAASVGGARTNVQSKTFSTNIEGNTNVENGASGTYVQVIVTPDSSNPYYDAVYKNLSSSPVTVSLMVGRD